MSTNNPKLESARAKLQAYYKLNKPSKTDLDSENFDASQYLSTTLNTKTLVELIELDNGLVTSIKSLDSDRKNLVYENYSKFINASQSIGSMRTKLKEVSSNLNLASQKLQVIEQESSYINDKLLDSKVNLSLLFKQFTTIKQVHFILKLPELLNKLANSKSYFKLLKLFGVTNSMLKRYRHLNLFKPIELECQHIVDNLQMELVREVHITKSYQELTNTYQLLLMIDSNKSEEYCQHYLELVLAKLKLSDKESQTIDSKLEALNKVVFLTFSTFINPDIEKYSLKKEICKQLELNVSESLQSYYSQFIQIKLREDDVDGDSTNQLRLFNEILHGLYRYPNLLPPVKDNLNTVDLLIPTKQLLLNLSSTTIQPKFKDVLTALPNYLSTTTTNAQVERSEDVYLKDPEKMLTDLINLENYLIQQYIDLTTNLQTTLFKDNKIWQLAQASQPIRNQLLQLIKEHFFELVELIKVTDKNTNKMELRRIVLARFLDDLGDNLIPTVLPGFIGLGGEDGTPNFNRYSDELNRMATQLKVDSSSLAKRLRFGFTFHLGNNSAEFVVEPSSTGKGKLDWKLEQVVVKFNFLERALQMVLPPFSELELNGSSSRGSESRSGRNSYSMVNGRKISIANTYPFPPPTTHTPIANASSTRNENSLLQTITQLFHTDVIVYKEVDNDVDCVLTQCCKIFLKNLDELLRFHHLDLDNLYQVHVGIANFNKKLPNALLGKNELTLLMDSIVETSTKRCKQIDHFNKEELDLRLATLN